MSSVPAKDRVSLGNVIAFGAPGLGAGYMYLLLAIYVMKFATDVLLIAPATMGTIIAASRVWDAISDPLAGYYSDRTGFAFGRRRTWILASTIPVAGMFIMVFSPPPELTGFELITWMTVAVIGFYSAMTLFFVPHLSLGAELSDNYHERSRLFGIRHGFYAFGSILSLISMQMMIEAEGVGEAEVRRVAIELSWLAAGVMIILTIAAVAKLRERVEFSGRVNRSPFGAFRDVWGNHHARLLIIVTFIERIGEAAIAVLTLYVAQYVVGAPALAPFIILAYFVPSTISVPMWIPLSRRFGKVKVWIFSMSLTGISFGGMFLLAFIENYDDRVLLMFVLAFFAGIAAGAGGTIAPSIQGDVIDYDEYKTGERKEGSYFAAWNFVYKAALGVMIMLTGYILEFTGYVPNAEQTMTVKVSMVTLYGLLPLLCNIVGVWLMRGFKLDEAEYAKIRAELDKRKRDLPGASAV